MIIGISGKKQHGKDTVRKIIQYLSFKKEEAYYSDITYQEFTSWGEKYMEENSGWARRAFADKLKDIVCSLIGCTREQLEDNDFKEKPLGDDWHCMVLIGTETLNDSLNVITYEHFQTLGIWEQTMYRHRKMTPRLLLQLLGTEGGRNIVHPNIWVNALMVDYKAIYLKDNPQLNVADYSYSKFPNWCIPDVRFHNEVSPIKRRGGFVFRVNNPRIVSTDTHYSETALDDYTGFDAIISNDGSIEELIQCVREILQTKALL